MSLAQFPTFEECVAKAQLTPSHLAVLTGLLEAIVPPVPVEELTIPPWQKDSLAVGEFAAASATTMHAIRTLVPLLALYKSSQDQAKVRLVLWLLTTGPGTLALLGFGRPFLELSLKERELGMLRLSNSAFNDLRMFFKDFKSVAALCVFGRSLKIDGLDPIIHNPTWKAIGYQGLTPSEKPLPQSFDHVWQPTFIDIEALAQTKGKEKVVSLETDVVVVGSGAGGGVVAGVLAKAGYRVIVVEKAKHRRFEDFTHNELESYFNTLENSGLLQSDDAAISVLGGSGFGGGTAINWACSLRTPGTVREEWAAQHGLPHFVSQSFSDSLDAVCARAGVSDKNIPQNVPNQILLDGCRRLGYPASVLPQNVGASTHSCGFCNLGCPYAEKLGTHLTWLNDAADCGARFIQNLKVDRVLHISGRATGVEGFVTDSGTRVVIKAKTVVSSCGSLNTPLLLTRSGLKNPDIGKNLKLHPVAFVQGHFPDREVNPHQGAIMTAISHVLEDRLGTGYGARLEVPALHPGLFSIIAPYRGAAAFKSHILQYTQRSSLIVLTRDKDSTAAVRSDSQGITHIDFSLGTFDAQSLTEGVVASCKVLLAAGAAEIETGLPGLEPLSFTKQEVETGNTVSSDKAAKYFNAIKSIGVVATKARLGSAHQMGSCRMSATPAAGVVNPRGETWEVKGLYVADASVFPTASGVNPMITTFAVAHSIAGFILEDIRKEVAKL